MATFTKTVGEGKVRQHLISCLLSLADELLCFSDAEALYIQHDSCICIKLDNLRNVFERVLFYSLSYDR